MTAGCLGGGDDNGSGLDTDGPIRFGSLHPLPGEFPVGTAYQESIELFVQQLNDDGGLLGNDVEWVEKDTELDPSQTRDRYRELILEDEVDVTFGVFASEAATVLQDEMTNFDVLHICGGASGMRITEELRNNYEEYNHWFRTNWNAAQYGNNLAAFSQAMWDEMGYSTIGIAAEDIEGFQPIIDNAVDGMPDSVDLAFREDFATDTTDFTPVLDRGESEDIDFMFAFIGSGGVPLTIQWANRQPDFELGGADVFSSTQAHYENTDGAIEHMWTYVSGSGPGFEHNERTEEMLEAYRDMHGHDPVHSMAFPHYDSIETFVRAVEEVESLDSEELISYIRSDLEYEGVCGPVDYYGQDGEFPHDTVYTQERAPPIIQWQDGEQVGLWPDTNQTGEYQPVPWV